MSPTKLKDPFAGLQRKRLPGMHLITALDGGVSLPEALGAFFFMMLHDRYEHGCLLKPQLEELEAAKKDAVHGASSPDSAFLASTFGSMTSANLVNQEWSYLPENEIYIFHMLANTAAEQTQRWINAGVEDPFRIPLGLLVERPAWAITYRRSMLHTVQDRRAYVERMRAEVAASDG